MSRILLYPVKSCAGIELETANLTMRGLETLSSRPVRDREYLLVDSFPEKSTGYHKGLTQRDRGLQKMVLITPRIRGGKVQLGWDNQDMIELPCSDRGKELSVRVHLSFARGIDQGDEVARLLSDYLQKSVRLVRASPSFPRMAGQNYVKNDNQLSWQDAYSVNWLFEESVEEVRSMLGRELSHKNFRPNIVCSGGTPSLEHSFYHVQFGVVSGIQPKPSSRCMIVNVDYKTGIMPRTMPLTLQVLFDSYNWKDINKQMQAIFAENFLPSAQGRIEKFSDVFALSWRDPPLVYGKKVAS